MSTAKMMLACVLTLGLSSTSSARADEAADLLAKAIRLFGEGEKLSELSGLENIEAVVQKQFEANQAISRAVELRPKDATIRAWSCLVKSRFYTGEVEDALAEGDEAVRLDPKLPLAYRYRGQVRARKGLKEDAVADFSAAIRLSPRDPKLLAERAEIHAEAKHDDLALGDYEAAIKLAPNDGGLRVSRGNLFFEMGRKELAAKDADEAIRLAPESPKARLLRVMLRFEKNDMAGIVDDLGAALAGRPDVKMFALRGGILTNLDRREEANQDFTSALRLKSAGALYAMRGSNLEKLGKHVAAVSDFTQALAEEEKAEFYFLRAQSQAELGKSDEAIKDCDEGLARDPKSVIGLALRGQSFLYSDRPERAVLDLAEASRLDPNRGIVRLEKAWALLLAGRDQEASKEARLFLDREGFRFDISSGVVIVAYLAEIRSKHDADAKAILEKGLAEGSPKNWHYAFLRYLHGDLKEEDLIAKRENPLEKAEAKLLIAIDLFLKGDAEGAATRIRSVKAEERTVFAAMSRDILRRIDVSKLR